MLILLFLANIIEQGMIHKDKIGDVAQVVEF
jgi:hypothetical protein